MPEIDCLSHCKGVCCSDMVYWKLTSKEADLLTKNGTSLTYIRGGVEAQGKSEYRRNGRCGLLGKDDKCKAYNGLWVWSLIPPFRRLVQRPEICGGFPPGQKGCLNLRYQHPEEIITTPADIRYSKWYEGEGD